MSGPPNAACMPCLASPTASRLQFALALLVSVWVVVAVLHLLLKQEEVSHDSHRTRGAMKVHALGSCLLKHHFKHQQTLTNFQLFLDRNRKIARGPPLRFVR